MALHRPKSVTSVSAKRFPFVIASARTDRIDVALVASGCGMHFGIAVDLGGRGLEKPRATALRSYQAVVGAAAADHRRSDGIGLVMRRRGGAGEIVNLVDQLGSAMQRAATMSCSMISNRPLASSVADIFPPAGLEIV